MPGVKSLDKIREKWKRVTSGAQAEYLAGVQDPRTDWAAATANAESAYDKGVQQGITQKRFGKGVKKAGTGKWQTMAVLKGPHRWSEGTGLAETAYAEGFAPYHRELAAITYPPKGPKGDPANLARVAVVAKRLHELKLRLKGGA